jgi:hypothetical protein
MKIIFRPIHHDPMEIIVGQFIWFHPIEDADAISVTANPDGFTTQNRVGQLLGYDQKVMVDAAKICNEKYTDVKQYKRDYYLHNLEIYKERNRLYRQRKKEEEHLKNNKNIIIV